MKNVPIKLQCCWGRNLNPFYDPDTCNNGGGYWQPQGGAFLYIGRHPVVVEISDTSCGDFGTRKWVRVFSGTHDWEYYRNTMDDCGDSPRKIYRIWDSIEGCLNCDMETLLDVVRAAIDTVAYRDMIEDREKSV